MLRKIFSMILMLSMMFVGSVAMAAYPEYLGGDKNYVLCDGHQGIGYYLDARTLNVEKYSPPDYVIYIEYVMVNEADRGNTQPYTRSHYRFAYNWNAKKIYRQNKDGSWYFLDPNSSRATGADTAHVADKVFQMAYNMPFYDNLK